MPRRLQIEFSQVIQKIADETGKEIIASEIWETFQKTYLNNKGKFNFVEHHIKSSSSSKSQEDLLKIKITEDGIEKQIEGSGNGPIDAFISALKNDLNLSVKISDFHQHAISTGSDAKAVAYIEIQNKGESSWGVGMHANTVIASFLSVISGLNKISSS